MLNIELVQRVKTVPCWNIWRICFQIKHKRRTLCQKADWILTNWINNILHKHDVNSIWDHTKYLQWSKANTNILCWMLLRWINNNLSFYISFDKFFIMHFFSLINSYLHASNIFCFRTWMKFLQKSFLVNPTVN